MQKNKNRQGLALGAVFAMVASLVVMTSPAQANQNSVVIAAAGSTETVMLHGEKFELDFTMGNNVADRYVDFSASTHAGFGMVITKPAGVIVTVSDSGGITASTAVVANTATSFAISTSASASNKVIGISVGGTTVSASIAITVTPFLDYDRDGVKDSIEPFGDPITFTFVPLSYLTATIAVEQPLAGATYGVTGSFAVTAKDLNYAQLDSDFTVRVTRSGTLTSVSAGISGSSIANATAAATSVGINGGVTTSARAYSVSFEVAGPAFTKSHTVSADVMYNGVVFKTSSTVTVATVTVEDTTLSPVAGVNAKQTGIGTADVRMNSAFTLNAYPYTGSKTVSVAVASKLTVSGQANIDFDADSGVILNGTTYTQSSTFLAAGFTLASGTKTVAVSTFGQSYISGSTMTLILTSQQKSEQLVVTVKPAEQVVVFAPAAVAGLAGTAKSFALTAYDQWDVASVRTDQRVAASVVLGGSTSATVSADVVGGKATVTVTPNPAARTGSGVVTFTLQTFNQATQDWANVVGSADTASWNVYAASEGDNAFTSRTVSISGSISYGVALSWSNLVDNTQSISLGVAISFSEVAVSAPGLMIQDLNNVTATGSETLTVTATNQTANFAFTSRMAGTYLVTFTNGTSTTTSEVVIDVAAHDSGATLTFDKTSIAAGTTTTVTGTLKDVNGNPVMTSGSSDVSVAWTGKGLPFGNTTDMETDAAGQLTFYVLVLSGEVGDAAISATYKPAGLAVSTKNVSVVHAVAVGKAAASADQKVNVGTFKGYVALYAKGYEGQKMSAIVAGKWIVVASLASDFERVVRFTGAGYTITTKIYIDGVQIGDEFTTVTK
jgi:hypothetical protein